MYSVYPTNWSCTQNPVSSSTDCVVTATTTDASSTASAIALHGELGTIIFGHAILIVFATMIFAGMLWNAIKHKK